MSSWKIDVGDSLQLLAQLEPSSIDSIVTDPPAGIGFMGRDWDKDKGGRDQWISWMSDIASECLRVLKPGGYALVWALPRTSHWTATAWEDAGFEVRDRIAHIFGSGFPKSRDVALGIDTMLGHERADRVVSDPGNNAVLRSRTVGVVDAGSPVSDEAKQWQGWGTGLKPAAEDWWVFRKPLGCGTVAANVMEYGTGALNIDACKVEGERWPTNLALSHLPGCHEDSCEIGCAVFEMGREAGYFPTFRYQAKPSSSEKSAGLEHREVVSKAEVTGRAAGSAGLSNPASGRAANSRNPHPTTKPVKLMRHLCRLVTPPGGLVLDPFTGSGTTGCAALCEDFRFLGFEQDATYAEVARERMRHWDADIDWLA